MHDCQATAQQTLTLFTMQLIRTLPCRQDMSDADAFSFSPEGLWRAIVDVLRNLQQEPATAPVDFLLLGLQGSISAASVERVPKAVWRKLIADEKVCSAVGVA